MTDYKTRLRTAATENEKLASDFKDAKTLFGLKTYHETMARALDQQMQALNLSSDEDNSVDEENEDVKLIEAAYGGTLPDTFTRFSDLTTVSAAQMVKNGEMSQEEFKLVIDNDVQFRMKV